MIPLLLFNEYEHKYSKRKYQMAQLPLPIRDPKVISLSGYPLKVVSRNNDVTGVEIPSVKERISIAMNGRIEIFTFSEILYVVADSNYVRFYLKERAMVFASKTLKSVSATLEQAGFVRVHKSFMLHLSNVQQYDIHHGFLLLQNGEKIPVSRSNRKLVSEKLLAWSL